jgi:hypothetical protein
MKMSENKVRLKIPLLKVTRRLLHKVKGKVVPVQLITYYAMKAYGKVDL